MDPNRRTPMWQIAAFTAVWVGALLIVMWMG